MSGAISPKEVKKGWHIPEEVFEVFNELIAENNGVVYQDEAVKRIVRKMESKDPNFDRNTIYQKGWLDIEDAYLERGWNVGYDKPAYNETYSAYFTFRTK